MSTTTLKERIAAIERGESPKSSLPGKSLPSSPPKSQTPSASFPGLKDRIARFEGIGGTPIPRGSFGLGAPVHHDKRSNELYGNRIPSVQRSASHSTTHSSTVTPATSSEGLHAAFSRDSSRSSSLNLTSPLEDLRASSTSPDPSNPTQEITVQSPIREPIIEVPEAGTRVVSEFTPTSEVLDTSATQLNATSLAPTEEENALSVVEEKPGSESQDVSEPSSSTIIPITKEPSQDEDPDSSDGNTSNPRSSLTSVTSNEAPAPVTPISPLFDSFPVPPQISPRPTVGEHTRSRSAHFADDLAVPARSSRLSPSDQPSGGKPLARSATTTAAGRRPRSKVLQPGVWINSDDEGDDDDDEGPGWVSVTVTKRYL